jgi:hypothetical protein
LLAVSAAGAAGLRAQIPQRDTGSAIAGRVTDTLGAPLAYCYVASPTATASATCDDSGRFRLGGLPAGRNILIVRRLGYGPGKFTLQLSPDSTLAVVVQLAPVATQLEAINVTREGLFRSLVDAGFYERLREHEIGLYIGTFITPEEFASLHANLVTDAFQGRPGVTLAYSGQLVVPWGRFARCLLNVYVDGLEIRNLYEMPNERNPDHVWLGEPGLVIGEHNRVTGIGIDGFVKPNEVLAIEIYPSGANAPTRFRSANSCGAIVIWTNRP